MSAEQFDWLQACFVDPSEYSTLTADESDFDDDDACDPPLGGCDEEYHEPADVEHVDPQTGFVERWPL